jgi:VWFA-related protein
MSRLLLAGVLAALTGAAQAPAPPEAQAGPVFRTESNLALVKFHLIRKGMYANDLRPDDIHLLEDGQPQKIALFEGPGVAERRTIPVEIILLFDVSLSVMDENLLDSYAIRDTLLAGLGNRVGVSVYAFGGRFKKFTGPTNDVEKLKEALDQAYRFANPGTPLYESIVRAAKDAWETGGPNIARAMVIFSDGEGTTKAKPELASKGANQYGVTLYPVVLGHARAVNQAMLGGNGAGFPGQPNPQQEARMARLRDKEAQMEEFAGVGEATGGRSFDPSVMNNIVMKTILSAVVSAVRYEYVAGFYPPSSSEKKSHKLEVKLVAKGKGKLSGGAATVIH